LRNDPTPGAFPRPPHAPLLKFLLLNQTFYPDVVSTSQYLQEIALELVHRGHEVTVITSRRAYDRPDHRFATRENWRGIHILRVGSTGFGKAAKWRRAADFATFSLSCAVRLAFLPRHDAILALTSPPLISFLGAWLARLRRCRFYYWVMDFNPDQAVAAGWLRPASPAARLLERMSRFSLRQAARVIALDRFMRDRIVAKGVSPERVEVIPPWSHDQDVQFDAAGRERFRQAHGLQGRFVVMYAGNHSPCHPLDTLLQVAERMREDPGVVFCFMGGGSEFRKIQELSGQTSAFPEDGNVDAGRTGNILCLPYQPLDQLSAALSAADLHLVVMGAAFVGLVHPCKIYNILAVGAPVLCICPRPSHLSELLDSLPGYPAAVVPQGEPARLLAEIKRLREASRNGPRPAPPQPRGDHRRQSAVPRLIEVLEAQ